MLTRVERRCNADAGREIARPHAAADDDIVRVDGAIIGVDASHAIAIVADFGDLGVFKNLCTTGAGAFGQRLRDVDRIGIAIARDVDAAHDIIDIHNMREVFDFLRRDDMDGKIKHLRH